MKRVGPAVAFLVVASVGVLAVSGVPGMRSRACRMRHDERRLGEVGEAYRATHGRAPESLEALVAAGELEHVPPDPDGGRYAITIRGDGTWGLLTARGARAPSFLACLDDFQWTWIGLWVVAAGGVAAFVRTRRWAWVAIAIGAVVIAVCLSHVGPVS